MISYTSMMDQNVSHGIYVDGLKRISESEADTQTLVNTIVEFSTDIEMQMSQY